VPGAVVDPACRSLTVVVRDRDRARTFFGLLGFKEDKAVVIRGPTITIATVGAAAG
jgi:hypothetical protein